MNLAKGRNGKIGRQVPGQGIQAKIVQPSPGGYHRNLYLSEGQIENDKNYFAAQEKKSQALGARREHMRRIKNAKAEHRKKQQGLGISAQQHAAKMNPMNEMLRAHYIKTGQMGQSAKVAQSLSHQPLLMTNRPQVRRGMMGASAPSGAASGYHPKPRPPADFSNSGANMHLVPGTDPHGPYVWHSDNRRHVIKGNPLTRDGEYGPVTDYDRFVNGVDVNQSVVAGASMPVAGNTIAGQFEGMGKRLDGYLGKAYGQSSLKSRKVRRRGMGDDSVDFSYFDDVPAPDTSGGTINDPSAFTEDLSTTQAPPTDLSMPVTGNVAPTEAELEAATPDQPGSFDKVWTAAEVQADKTLPSLLQQQMLAALASGKKVATTGSSVVISQPGKAPTTIGTISSIPPAVIYASVGLIGVGLLLLFMKSRTPRLA